MNFNTTQGSDYWMNVNHLAVGFNMPPALKADANDDREFALPPYAARRGFLVDEYPACPPDWVRSEGKLASYFVPIREGYGAWLDFNENSKHSHHVAIVVSVQGVNAVTGLPCNDPQLEQYIEQCPKHKKPFGPNRLCEACGFKWPKQNYLCTTGTPDGQLWLDGFRAVDGAVRQYVMTAEQRRGVANAILGADRVFALGVSFFLSKEPRPPRQPIMRRQLMDSGTLDFAGDDVLYGYKGDTFGLTKGSFTHQVTPDTQTYCCSIEKSLGPEGPVGPTGDVGTKGIKMSKTLGEKLSAKKRDEWGSKVQLCSTSGGLISAPVRSVSVQRLEIAAGARIKQMIYDDPNPLEFWNTKPEGILVINYALEVDVEQILAAGRRDLTGHRDGFLQHIPVGNP